MNKKFSIQKTAKYLRELSVVVVGIAITFVISDWITNINKNKDIQLSFNTIKFELCDNLQVMIDLQTDYYEPAMRYEQFLLTADRQNMNADTLYNYIHGRHNINRYIPFFVYKSGAYDMLKSSGMMQLIKDKNKLKKICDCYVELETFRLASDFYIQRKIAELDKFGGISNKNIKSELLFDFFTCDLSRDMSKALYSFIKHIEETIALL